MKLAFYVSLGTILEGNVFSSNFYVFLIIFGQWARNFRPSLEIFSTGQSKLWSRCPWEQFENESFFWKKIIVFRRISESFSAFCRKFFCGLLKFYATSPWELIEKHFSGKIRFFPTFLEIEGKIFGLWSKIFQGLSKLFLTCPYENLVEKFILGSFILQFFAHWMKKFEQKTWSILFTSFWRGCQNCILRVHSKLLRKQLLLEKISFIDFQQRAKKLRTSGNFFRLGCETCILLVHRDNFRGKGFFSKFYVFLIIFRQWARNFRLSHKSFSTGQSKLWSRCPWEQFENKSFFWKKIIVFRRISESFSAFCRKFFCGLLKFYATSPWELIEKHFSGKIRFFPTFLEIEGKIFGLWSKIFRGLSKLFLTCPYENFVEKFILGSFILQFFAHWMKKFEQKTWSILFTSFWRGCQNCILRVHSKLLRKQLLLDKISFIDFQQRAKKLRTSGNFFRLGCETCILLVHRDNFRKQQGFFSKFYVFLIIFRQWARNFRLSLKSFSTGQSKLWSRCPWEQYENKSFFLKKKSSFFADWAKVFRVFRPSVENFSVGCWNSMLRLHESLSRYFFWENSFFFQHFWKLSKRFSGFGRKFFRGYQNCF